MTAIEGGGPAVLVTIACARGSVPREAGTHMIVTETGVTGTVGGGNLEYKAIAKARRMMGAGDRRHVQEYPLGPMLEQCCGGNAMLLFEAYDSSNRGCIERLMAADYVLTPLKSLAPKLPLAEAGIKVGRRALQAAHDAAQLIDAGGDVVGNAGDTASSGTDPSSADYLLEVAGPNALPLYIFGAGHVGRAVVNVLAPLNFDLHWIDAREAEFPPVLPPGLTQHVTEHPAAVLEAAPPRSLFLIFTHSHDLDYELVRAALTRGDARYIGLIGSRTKRVRFERRLVREAGLSPSILNQLTCPIGVGGIPGKAPSHIAIATAAQLLQIIGEETSEAAEPKGLAVAALTPPRA